MRRVFVLIMLVVIVAGCSSSQQRRRSSNLMSYLYPNATNAPSPNPSGAQLQLPLKIGIAFIPADHSMGSPLESAEAEKRLLDIVKKSFEGRDWVREIAVIPSQYLRSGGGFENLDQVSRLMGTDVVALVSVDQLQNSNPGKLSFLYLSIVGAYVLPLDSNETRTLIDAAVFHVPSRTFLLRAPGTSQVEGHSTAVEVSERLRETSQLGFQRAMNDLAKNLDAEVGNFKQSIVEGARTDVVVTNQQGESIRQRGSFGFLEALGGIFALLLAAWTRRSARA
jgi:rhombotail lipoprotein